MGAILPFATNNAAVLEKLNNALWLLNGSGMRLSILKGMVDFGHTPPHRVL
jgi:hypothetical protein